jgi:hypothetical protein
MCSRRAFSKTTSLSMATIPNFRATATHHEAAVTWTSCSTRAPHARRLAGETRARSGSRPPECSETWVTAGCCSTAPGRMRSTGAAREGRADPIAARPRSPAPECTVGASWVRQALRRKCESWHGRPVSGLQPQPGSVEWRWDGIMGVGVVYVREPATNTTSSTPMAPPQWVTLSVGPVAIARDAASRAARNRADQGDRVRRNVRHSAARWPWSIAVPSRSGQRTQIRVGLAEASTRGC